MKLARIVALTLLFSALVSTVACSSNSEPTLTPTPSSVGCADWFCDGVNIGECCDNNHNSQFELDECLDKLVWQLGTYQISLDEACNPPLSLPPTPSPVPLQLPTQWTATKGSANPCNTIDVVFFEYDTCVPPCPTGCDMMLGTISYRLSGTDEWSQWSWFHNCTDKVTITGLVGGGLYDVQVVNNGKTQTITGIQLDPCPTPTPTPNLTSTTSP